MIVDVRTEQIENCPLCGCGPGRAYCRASDRQHQVTAQIFAFAQCRRCGVVYQSVRPVEEDIGALYPIEYEPYRGEVVHEVTHDPSVRMRRWLGHHGLAGVEWINNRIRRRYPDPLPGVLDTLYVPPRRGATLLDFGCGSAGFLDQAAERGWSTIGCDFAAPVVEAVRRAGHRAFQTDDLWQAIPDGSVDLVRLNHVLEHLYEPRLTLMRLHRKLRRGGRLHLATPNAASLAFWIFRKRWFPLECPRHVVLYTTNVAAQLLQEVGFTTVDCYQEVLTKDAARSLGYVLVDLGRIDAAGALRMQHRPGLASVLFAPARLAALLGMADRFHVVAET